MKRRNFLGIGAGIMVPPIPVTQYHRPPQRPVVPSKAKLNPIVFHNGQLQREKADYVLMQNGLMWLRTIQTGDRVTVFDGTGRRDMTY